MGSNFSFFSVWIENDDESEHIDNFHQIACNNFVSPGAFYGTFQVFKLLPFGNILICREGRKKLLLFPKLLAKLWKKETRKGRNRKPQHNFFIIKFTTFQEVLFLLKQHDIMDEVYDGKFCWQFKKLFWVFSLSSFFSILGASFYVGKSKILCACVVKLRLQKEAFVQVDDSEEINFSLVPLTKCPLSAYILW